MKQKIFRFFSNPIASVVTLAITGVGVAYAQVPSAPTLVTSADTLDSSVFCPVVDIMFWVLISISIIMVLWAAYLYVISEGESEKPSQARKMLLYAAIGIALALVAKGFPSIVADVFGQNSGTFQLAC